MCGLTICVNAQGYEISIKIKHLKQGDEVILGHHFNEKLIPDDTVKLDAQGRGVFKGKDKLPGGMYFIFMPNRTYFDIIIDKNQKFSIENDTTDFLKNMVINNDLENQVFVEYQKFRDKTFEEYQAANAEYEKAKGNADKEQAAKDKLKAVNQKLEDRYHEQKSKYPNMFFTKFLTATRDIEVPESITDQNDRYYYYRNHFFDNFDVSDGRLLRTVIYQPKIERYIDKVVMQIPDTLIAETTKLIDKARTSDELFRFMLVFFFNKYAKSEAMMAENVYVSLARIYVKDAKWDTDSFKTQLKKKIDKKANCLVGNPAINLDMRVVPTDTNKLNALRKPLEEFKTKGAELEKAKPDFEDRRQDVARMLDTYLKNYPEEYNFARERKKYILLWFWEPDCSHCQKETPDLYKFYKDSLSNLNVAVWAIYMNKSVDKLPDLNRHMNKFFDFIKKNELNYPGWHNLWNPFDQYREHYDVNSTPTLFLIDEERKILAKRISFRQCYELIEAIEKEEKNIPKK